jgi:tetratricopeptide (TPR) repeat protein
VTDRTKTDEELAATKDGASGLEGVSPRSSVPPPRASLVPRAAPGHRPITPPVGVPRAPAPPRPPLPRATSTGSFRAPLPTAPARPPTPPTGVVRPPLPPVPRPPTLPRAPAPTPIHQDPPEVLLDEVEVDVVESIEPLALGSIPAESDGPSAAPTLERSASALAPPALPTFAAPATSAGPSDAALADFFADVPAVGEHPLLPALDEVATVMRSIDSVRPPADLPSGDVLEVDVDAAAADSISLSFDEPEELPVAAPSAASRPSLTAESLDAPTTASVPPPGLFDARALGVSSEDDPEELASLGVELQATPDEVSPVGEGVNAPGEEVTTAVQDVQAMEAATPPISADGGLDFALDDAASGLFDAPAPPSPDVTAADAPSRALPPDAPSHPPAPLAVEPDPIAEDPPSALMEPELPVAAALELAAPVPSADPAEGDGEPALELDDASFDDALGDLGAPVAAPSPEVEDASVPAPLADEMLDLDLDVLPPPRPAAPMPVPAAETTLEALEAGLFADTPMVDLGAPLPSDAGFADLALADDELDAMFRDLEVVTGATPTASDDAPALAAAPDEASDFAAFEAALDDDAPEVGEGDDDETLLIDGDDEEVDLEVEAPADRGALLAATVTSRKREQQDSDALFALDPKGEAAARVEMLSDEAGQDDSYLRAAEHLCVVAETLDGALGDAARARVVAERAVALAPEVVAATRLLRRLDVAEDQEAMAYRRALDELQTPLGDEERRGLLRLAAELAARVAPDEAPPLWDELSALQGAPGALAALFAGAQRRDPEAVAAALARWSDVATGELAASLSVARARLVEAKHGDDALEVIREAVRRDPADAGAWIAMARIAFAQVRADVAAEALAGLARSGEGGPLALAAEALGAAVRAITGQPVPSTTVRSAGVSAWLVLGALAEAGADPSSQQTAALEVARGAEATAWRAREGASDAGIEGRFHALRLALARRDDDAVARAAAAMLEASSGALAALLARAASVLPAEREALAGDGALWAVLSAAEGDPQARPRDDDPYSRIDAAERARRQGEGGVEEGIASLADIATGAKEPAAASFAARAVASLAGDPARVVEMLRVEAQRSQDARRGAASRLLAAALGAAYGVDDSAAGIAEAAQALPGDLAVAELAALFALRGELDPELGAELLDQASTAGDDRAHHTAAVRAALRRAAVDPDSAAEAVWRAWMRCPRDASLGTLVLRSPGQPGERVAAVLRTQIDAAHAEGAAGVSAAIAEGLQLAAVLEQSGRHAEAAQAVARARTLSLDDGSLVVAEERLWLKAGMFAEVAERAFEQLRAAREDEQRVAAYERLAELDRSFRGDIASSVLSFQAILEVAPGHVASQRTLERYFVEQGRGEELLDVYRRMVDHLSDPEDALAYAHVAARTAANLGDADLAAAGPFLRAAFARDLADRRLVISLEAEARRTADLSLFSAAHQRAAQFSGNDQERATSFVRAAEGYFAMGDHARGREAMEHALAVDPNHLVALQHVAEERAAAGDVRAAADACETLGRRLKVPAHAARFFYRAAAHYRATEPERALSLAREALARDPAHTDAWTLASEVARALGDARVEMELVAMRADAPPSGERGDALTLHLRASELALTLGDRDRARAELRRVVELDPSRVEALRTLARLTWEDRDWASAADASIRLAKLSHDPAERGEMLFRLGEIFDLHLPDTRRAEAAYRRVIQAAPDDTRALERLVALYHRTGDAAKEYEVLQALTARTMPGAERIARLLRVAELAESAMSDPARAELAFEGARREAPADVEVLRRYAAFLERSAAAEARKVLLERAGAEARRGVDLAPRDAASYDILIEVRRLRRDDAGARAIASVALSLGAQSELVEAHGSLTPEHPLNARAATPRRGRNAEPPHGARAAPGAALPRAGPPLGVGAVSAAVGRGRGPGRAAAPAPRAGGRVGAAHGRRPGGDLRRRQRPRGRPSRGRRDPRAHRAARGDALAGPALRRGPRDAARRRGAGPRRAPPPAGPRAARRRAAAAVRAHAPPAERRARAPRRARARHDPHLPPGPPRRPLARRVSGHRARPAGPRRAARGRVGARQPPRAAGHRRHVRGHLPALAQRGRHRRAAHRDHRAGPPAPRLDLRPLRRRAPRRRARLSASRPS